MCNETSLLSYAAANAGMIETRSFMICLLRSPIRSWATHYGGNLCNSNSRINGNLPAGYPAPGVT